MGESNNTERGPKVFECEYCGSVTYEHGPCDECGLEPFENPD